MTAHSAWDFIDVLEHDRVLEPLLSHPDNPLTYAMDPSQVVGTAPILLHLSCNTLSIPHIAYLAQQVFNAMQLDYKSVGGAESCCGAYQWATGDDDYANRTAKIALGGFKAVGVTQVVSTCPDCDIFFQLYMARQHKFRQTNILDVLANNEQALRPLLKNPINKRIVVHSHDENEMRIDDGVSMRKILGWIPGLQILDAEHSEGLGNHCIRKAGRLENTIFEPLVNRMFSEAKKLDADTLVIPYHGCYRQHVKRQIEYGVEVSHYLSLLAESMRIPYHDEFKRLRLIDDIDLAVDNLESIRKKNRFTRELVREALLHKIYV